jgi:hypothetical protein
MATNPTTIKELINKGQAMIMAMPVTKVVKVCPQKGLKDGTV